MRAETRSHRRRVTDPGPNWIRSGEDLLATDPVERVVFDDHVRPPTLPPHNLNPSGRRDPPSRPVIPADLRGHATPVPSKTAVRPSNRLMLAPSLPPMIAADSLPPIYDDESFVPSCRAVDSSYAGVVAGVRATGRTWSQEEQRTPDPDPEDQPTAAAAPPVLPFEEPEDPDDERSTGLFEPGEDPWSQHQAKQHLQSYDEIQQLPPDPQPPSAVRPSLALVRSVSESVEEEFVGMRAAPLATEPRPGADEVVDWPPPMVRPGIDYPPDWSVDEVGNTLIVIDPLQRRGGSRLAVLLLDLAAWILGFVAMFLTGLVTTGSAGLVFFALSL